MLEVKKCKQCGENIIIDYIKPCITFGIEDGEIIQINNDVWQARLDGPYTVPYCSADREHDIGDLNILWVEEVEQEIIRYLVEGN